MSMAAGSVLQMSFLGWSYASSAGPLLVNTHDCNMLKHNTGVHKWVIAEEEQ